MAVKQTSITVTLDESAKKILDWLNAQGHFTDENVIVQEALHSLYREWHQKRQAASLPDTFEPRDHFSPDDFE